MSIEELRKRIECAFGKRDSDIVLKNGKVVNVFTGRIEEKDVAICDGIIAGVGKGYRGKEEIDLSGYYLLPGFIDSHMHIESSMLTPYQLSLAVSQHGTTCVIADPHEIANVMGKEGIDFMIEDSKEACIDFFFMLPSCVPATHLETSGAELTYRELSEYIGNPYILGLAEMMNYPAVLNGDEEVLRKLSLFQTIDGHCPSLRGKDLQAYICAGISSDHESIDPKEAEEKIESGMFLMIREGSTAKNMEDLISVINEKNFHRACFVSDDLHPEDIKEKGHMDFILRKAVSLGLDPITAIRMVTINPAIHFGLRDRGSISAGKRADIVVVQDLKRFEVVDVFKDGRKIKGKRERSFKKMNYSINIGNFFKEKLKILVSGNKVRVIEIIPDQIVNRMTVVEPLIKNGEICSDTDRDILKICVVERHKGTGNVGIGLVKGFGIKKGAIASSVSHDSHNIVAVGVDDEDIYRAIVEIRDMGGGMVVVSDGKAVSKVRLEIAGLMTNSSLDELLEGLKDLDHHAKGLGISLGNPFMILSFLSLPVIPELRITDKGLVDVNRFELVSLFL